MAAKRQREHGAMARRQKVNRAAAPELFFTKEALLDEAAEHIAERMLPEHTFVDFACGNNGLAARLAEKGIKCITYDVSDEYVGVPVEGVRFECRDWLSVDSIPAGSCIGFNPPFGCQGWMARKFIEHALRIAEAPPPFFFLLIPRIRDGWLPKGYVASERRQVDAESFYRPKDETPFAYPTELLTLRPGTEKRPKPVFPEGFSAVTVSPNFPKEGFVPMWPQTGTEVAVRTAGCRAGAQYFVKAGELWTRWDWYEDGKFKEQLEVDARVRRGTCFMRITLPEKWAGENRKGLLERMAPELLRMRKAQNNKRGVSKKDLMRAVGIAIET